MDTQLSGTPAAPKTRSWRKRVPASVIGFGIAAILSVGLLIVELVLLAMLSGPPGFAR